MYGESRQESNNPGGKKTEIFPNPSTQKLTGPNEFVTLAYAGSHSAAYPAMRVEKPVSDNHPPRSARSLRRLEASLLRRESRRASHPASGAAKRTAAKLVLDPVEPRVLMNADTLTV